MPDFQQLDRFVVFMEGVVFAFIIYIIYKEIIPELIEFWRELFSKRR